MSKSENAFAALELNVDAPARMTIVHPVTRQPLRDEEGNVAFVEVLAADSAVAKSRQRETLGRRLATRGRVKITVDQVEAEAVETLTALTVGWHLVDLAGKPIAIDFSAANARSLYSTPALSWLRDQVDEYAADISNFVPVAA